MLHLNSLFEVTNSIQIQTIDMYESQQERFKHMSVCVIRKLKNFIPRKSTELRLVDLTNLTNVTGLCHKVDIAERKPQI